MGVRDDLVQALLPGGGQGREIDHGLLPVFQEPEPFIGVVEQELGQQEPLAGLPGDAPPALERVVHGHGIKGEGLGGGVVVQKMGKKGFGQPAHLGGHAGPGQVGQGELEQITDGNAQPVFAVPDKKEVRAVLPAP